MPPTADGVLGQQLRAFEFRMLLVEGLGWNHSHGMPVTISIEDENYTLTPVAEKAGFAVYECSPDTSGAMPPYPIRRKIESKVATLVFEHLIIYADGARTTQVWQWVKRQHHKPPVCREQALHPGQTGAPLLQRLRQIAFSLDEEGTLDVAGVASRIRLAMDAEEITKRFYKHFKDEMAVFCEFIDGITGQGDRQWYASLMLNRMMFVYFIQKQGFLDGDPDYLRNRLDMLRGDGGAGRFQQFYRVFLLRLFHEGLGAPETERAPELVELLGQIPFLNGGLFDVHDLERDNPEISIPDAAFQRVFDFFDGYRWHLDERPGKADNEINSDVLGYIFEKYVNQKQMGAYYTKEDITGYISRNTVIPFLFDAAKKECPVAFGSEGGVWRLLRDDPDRYIYPAVGHGVTWNARNPQATGSLESGFELPADIAAGLDDVSQRGGWNRPAPDDYALPTETWREVVARRTRHREVRDRLASGEVWEINDLITLNVDIERFARDVIAQSEGPELLRAFWHAMRDISVLDPTCGSGAFLFAALNILEPLYTDCLEGMRGFLDDLERTGRPHSDAALSDFREVLGQMERHPSERYFILKSIVLNNLYGVDIMEEAVEICKLRLFLKLVAQLETYEQIEPLPDIDFNIRAGNTLVGFTSLDAVRRAMTVTPDGQHLTLFEEELIMLDLIEEEAEVASRAFDQFRAQQTTLGGEVTAADKTNLRLRLEGLGGILDSYLATEYGVDAEDADAYDAWRASHQPFHWFVEFYGIMSKGGFDAVIGNPPYVAKRKVTGSYTLKGFRTDACPDIYAAVVERSVNVCRANGRASMIVPLSLTFSGQFPRLRALLYEECATNWFASFGRIPSALFSFDTRVRNTIWIGRKSPRSPARCHTTRLHRWFTSQRPTLFQTLSYAPFSPDAFEGAVPKLGSARLLAAFESLLRADYRLGNELSPRLNGAPLHFKQTAYNWLTFAVDQPPAYGPDGTAIPQTEYGTVKFTDEGSRGLAMLLASGKLMFAWWLGLGDDFHLTKRGFTSAPLGPAQLPVERRACLRAHAAELEEAMAENVVFKLNAGKNIGNYNLTRCRHITDQADKLWLEALGLGDLWEEIELEHSLVVRTSFKDE